MGGETTMIVSTDNSSEVLLKGMQEEIWGSKKNCFFGLGNTAAYFCADRHDSRERGQELGHVLKQEWEVEIQCII